MTQESDIRAEIMRKYNATFPGGNIDRVWCGQVATRHGARIIGARKGTPDLIGVFWRSR